MFTQLLSAHLSLDHSFLNKLWKKERPIRFHVQITETTQLQLEAKVKVVLVLQGLGAWPCAKHRASHCHSELFTYKIKTKRGYSRNGTQLTTWSGLPFNFFCTICKRPQCTEGVAEAALQGISPRGNKGPKCCGDIWALAGGMLSSRV